MKKFSDAPSASLLFKFAVCSSFAFALAASTSAHYSTYWEDGVHVWEISGTVDTTMSSHWYGRLVISANNVKLNMNQCNIIGNGTGIGIFVDSSVSGVKISNPSGNNGAVFYFNIGVYAYYADACTLWSISSDECNYDGFLFLNCSDPYVLGCAAYGRNYHGIEFNACTSPDERGSLVSGCGHSGIWFQGCEGPYSYLSSTDYNTYYGHVQLDITTNDFYYLRCTATGNGTDGFTANNADGLYDSCVSSYNTCGFSEGNGSSVDYDDCTGVGNVAALFCSW